MHRLERMILQDPDLCNRLTNRLVTGAGQRPAQEGIGLCTGLKAGAWNHICTQRRVVGGTEKNNSGIQMWQGLKQFEVRPGYYIGKDDRCFKQHKSKNEDLDDSSGRA